jgi:hypothetical protein
MLQKLGKENFGTWVYKKQAEVMEDRLLKLPEEQDLRDSVHRLFAVNRVIPYLGTGGEELSGKMLNKILTKILPSQAIIEYMRSGEEDLTDDEDILTKNRRIGRVSFAMQEGGDTEYEESSRWRNQTQEER